MNTSEAKLTHRQRVRAAGMHGDYWYPAMWSKDLGNNQVKEIVFWKESIAIYRDAHGELHAVEDRCPHRNVKLSLGHVEGCNLNCEYHGWSFNGDGLCTHVGHEVRTKNRPEIRVGSYPVTEKYGLIWFFPGDPAKASLDALPKLEPVERGWTTIPVDFVNKCHFSMIIENVCDFYHEYLHRDYRPFYKAKLTGVEEHGDSIQVSYATTIGGGPLVRHFANAGDVNLQQIKLWFDYPFQRSDIDGKYLHWMFVRPIDERTTHTFYVFTFKSFKMPFFDQLTLPKFLIDPVLRLANKFYVLPVLNQDNWIMAEEQLGHDKHGHKPVFEFNPFVSKAQQLTLRKWEEFQASLASRVVPKPTKRAPAFTVASD